jgi:predicted Rossmann-fold nucleotide-binding protein
VTAVRPIVAVVGGSDCTSAEAALAEALGRQLAQRGAVVVCGGLTGVMEAVAKGARAGGGLATGMGEMRNALIVRVAGAIVAIGGGTGTLSEIALALRIGTPVVGLQDNFAALATLPRVTDAAAAADWALARAR